VFGSDLQAITYTCYGVGMYHEWEERAVDCPGVPRWEGRWNERKRYHEQVLEGVPAWDHLDIADIDKYISSMPDRVDAILQAKGGHTHF
jgi:hypothetical protein